MKTSPLSLIPTGCTLLTASGATPGTDVISIESLAEAGFVLPTEATFESIDCQLLR